MKLDKNYKVRVTPEQSRKIQGLLFDCGFQWAMTGQTIHPDREIILIEPDKLRLLNGAKSTLKFYIEIAADDLIALLTDLSKSAENPLRNAELTPEFEAVDTNVSKPQFKAGDLVYCFGEKRINKINEYVGDETYSLRDSETLYQADYLTLATQENYERLQATFPAIEFEAPPKELTGSDLCRAMLEKGWQYIPCYVSNYGESEAQKPCIVRKFSSNGQFMSEFEFYNNAVPFDPRTGEPLTEAVLDE